MDKKLKKVLKWLLAILIGGSIFIYLSINIYNTYISSNSNNTNTTSSNNSTTINNTSNTQKITKSKSLIDANNDSWDYEDHTIEFNGNRVKFRIALLAHKYRWEYGKHEYTESGKLDTILSTRVFILDGFRQALQFVAVGVASEEGKRAKEIDRADRRADEIQHIILPAIGLKKLYKLNLGQYASPTGLTPDLTAYQRRVIIIAVLERDATIDETDFKTALKTALGRSTGLSFNTRDYSNYDLTKIQ